MMMDESNIDKYIHVNWYKIKNKLKIVMRLRVTFILENGDEHTVIFKHDFSKKSTEISDEEMYIKNHIENIRKEFIKELKDLLKNDYIDVSVIEFYYEDDRIKKKYIKEERKRKYVDVILEK